MKKYITIDEFAKEVNVKVTTIKKRYKEKGILGIERAGDEWFIMRGTRYPYNLRARKPKLPEDFRYIILRAIAENKYIDEKMLHISKSDFSRYIQDYVNQGALEKNTYSWFEGTANNYQSTPIGDHIVSLGELGAKREIAVLLGTVIGAAGKQFID
jgi:hypothetical protein